MLSWLIGISVYCSHIRWVLNNKKRKQDKRTIWNTHRKERCLEAENNTESNYEITGWRRQKKTWEDRKRRSDRKRNEERNRNDRTATVTFGSGKEMEKHIVQAVPVCTLFGWSLPSFTHVCLRFTVCIWQTSLSRPVCLRSRCSGVITAHPTFPPLLSSPQLWPY